MSIISIPFTFSPGGTIISSQVNSCFSTIYNDYNGSIGNSNLSSTLVIQDTKLAQIVDASKVSGTALTNLNNIPSGAGVIPAANLPAAPTGFGAWTSGTLGTIYQAATDLLIIVYAVNSGSGETLSGITDGSSTPTTVRATVNTNAGTNPGCITFFVRSGDYYQVTGTFTSSTMSILPLGL